MDTPLTPHERLALSRERLRLALNGVPADAAHASGAAGTPLPWWHSLRALPGAGVVVAAAQQWWVRHPLRATTLVAFEATQALIIPLARRHPLACVAGAFALGGLVVWRRPLRASIFRSSLLTGFWPQLLTASLAARALPAPKSVNPR